MVLVRRDGGKFRYVGGRWTRYGIQGTPIELYVYNRGLPYQRYEIRFPTTIRNHVEALNVFREVAKREGSECYIEVPLDNRYPLNVDPTIMQEDVEKAGVLMLLFPRKDGSMKYIWKVELTPSILDVVSDERKLPPYFIEDVLGKYLKDRPQQDLSLAFLKFEKRLMSA